MSCMVHPEPIEVYYIFIYAIGLDDHAASNTLRDDILDKYKGIWLYLYSKLK